MEYGYLILLACAVVVFGLLTLLRRWIDSFILIALAIGAVVGAGIYQGIDTPVKAGPLIFSISGLLYPLFYYCVIIKYFYYPLNETRGMAFSSFAAVVISAFVEFFAMLASKGYSWDIVARLLYYLYGTVFNFLVVYLSLLLVHQFEKHKVNRYVSITVFMILTGVLCATLYFSAGSIFLKEDTNFLPHFLASLISVGICTLLALGSYAINSTVWFPKNLKRPSESNVDKR